jgi:hypothetical protein
MFSYISIYFLIIFIPILIVLIGLNLPNQIELNEKIVVNKTPSEVFKYFADFKIFTSWCPWFNNVPTSQITYHGENMTTGSKVKYRIKNKSIEKFFELNHLEINQKIIFDIDLGFTQKGKMEIDFTNVHNNKTSIYWNFYLPLGNNPIEKWFGFLVKHSYHKNLRNGLKKLQLKLEYS